MTVVGKFREIQLNTHQYAVISHDDYALVSKYNWNYKPSQFPDNGYAVHRYYEGKVRKTLYMHRLIVRPPDYLVVDHKDGFGLHNWRENLRMATHSENRVNCERVSSTGFRGVQQNSPNSWKAKITRDGDERYLGSFPSPEAAARAYDVAALELHGDFAILNFEGARPQQARTSEVVSEDIPW